MKIFTEEKGKKEVHVQAKDLIFISRHFRTPDKIKNLIPIKVTSSQMRPDEYYSFSDPSFVEFMKKDAKYVIDKDEYDLLSDDQLETIKKKLLSELRVSNEKFNKLPKKEKKVTSSAYIGLRTLEYLFSDVQYYEMNERQKIGKNIK